MAKAATLIKSCLLVCVDFSSFPVNVENECNINADEPID